MKKHSVLILVLLIIVAGIIAVISKRNRQVVNNQALIKITMAVPKSLPYPKPEVIARDKGFFKEEGLDVNLV